MPATRSRPRPDMPVAGIPSSRRVRRSGRGAGRAVALGLVAVFVAGCGPTFPRVRHRPPPRRRPRPRSLRPRRGRSHARPVPCPIDALARRRLAGRHRRPARGARAAPPRSVARHPARDLGRRRRRGQGADPDDDRRPGPRRTRSGWPRCRAGPAATAIPGSSRAPVARTSTRSCSGSSATASSSPRRARRTGTSSARGSRPSRAGRSPMSSRSSSRWLPRDNPSTLLAYAPLYLRMSEVLAGLGVTRTGRAGDVRGRRSVPVPARTVEIAPITADEDVAWHGGDPLSLPAGDALWLRRHRQRRCGGRISRTRGRCTSSTTRSAAASTASPTRSSPGRSSGDVDRVVVDLRNNGGGDNTTYRHLLEVIQDPAIDRPGRLDLLIGRLTFSAAANFATEVETTTGATFVGEPMGGSPNLYGDARPTDLPYGGQTRLRRDALLAEEHGRRSADHHRARPRRSRSRPRTTWPASIPFSPRSTVRHARRCGRRPDRRRYPRPVTESPDLLITRRDRGHRGGVAPGRRGRSRRADQPRSSPTSAVCAGRRARPSTRPGCWSSPAPSTSTRTRASRPTSTPIASSRIPSRRRSVARPRSCRSTTRGRGRRPRPSVRC